ncbi:hypothetical protein HZB69_03955 [Candidatus Amesbacteria bacterium]|nr:hypothetical protein [Candidatus Amesbacteria bacterium]
MPKKLSLILALGLVLRIGFLTISPPELFGDEIDVGYQAYSLLKTGQDIYRQFLPFYIHSLAEWRAPLLMYATVPTIAIAGLNEYGVRLPEVIFGVLGIAILFLLTKKYSIAFALAILPWHIHYSRAAFEVVLMLDLIMLGTLLFLKRRFALGFLMFALSMYTYSTTLLFVPLWIGYLLIKEKVFPVLQGLFFGLLIAPLLYFIFLGPARDRFGILSLTNNREIIDKVYTLRKESTSTIVKFFVNKPFMTSGEWFMNYLRPFSSEFLFVRGDPVMRHNIQVIGQLLPLTAPFLLLGLYILAKKRQWLWLVWLVLAPIPASLTSDGGYHATRLFLMVPPLAVAIGTGLSQIKNKYLLVTCYLLLVTQLIWVGYYYLNHYSKQSWRWWHVGYKNIMTQITAISDNYSRVFINNSYEPALMRFLFWTRYDPAKFHKNFMTDKPQENIVPGYDGFSLDGKYIFGSFNGKEKLFLPNSLYLISQREDVAGDWDWRESPPDNIELLGSSSNPYGQAIFYLVTKK